MTAAVLLLGAGVLASSMAVAVYADDAQRWRRSLHAYQLHLPRDLTVDDAARWLAAIAAATHPPRWSLFPLPPLAVEVLATQDGIAHYVLVDSTTRATLLATVQAALPGARLVEAPAYLHTSPHTSPRTTTTVAAEFALTSQRRPLAADRVEPVSAGLLAALQPLGRRERLTVQLIMTSAGTPAPTSAASQNNGARGLASWWWQGHAPANADELHARHAKQRESLLVATLRIGVTATSRRRAAALLSRATSVLPGLNAPGVRLVRRLVPSFVIVRRLAARRYPLIEWPLLLTVHEAAGLVALPFHAHLPGLPASPARQLPPSPALPTVGAVIGRSNYPGLTRRALALGAADRLGHVHLIGPTGTGKSTLLAQLALQDIAHGHGVVVIDPKGDLVHDIAARIPERRIADVVFLDPSDVQTDIIGFNPLHIPPGEDAARELIADRVLGIFHALYYEFWGPRTDEILRAALFSLAYATARDGSPYTLIEVPELLTNPAFRRSVCAQPTLPPYLRAFWQWFDGSLRPADRVEATGPVLNKVRAFAMRGNLRLLLGQSRGMDLREHLRERRVLLLSLAKGTLGAEAASLLGSLFVAALWQAAQARITLPSKQRHPIFTYLDEFQDVVRLGADASLADMLAQARGLGLSLTLAHQYLSQLPPAVREATLGTVRTHIAFQLAWGDAQALATRFAPLTIDDLTGLDPFEFALQPYVASQTLPPVTGVTLSLGAAIRDADTLARASRARYGLPRAEVEAGLQARLGAEAAPTSGRYGRATTKPKGGRV